MKPLTKILIVLGLIVSFVGVMTINAFLIAPSNFSIRTETLQDDAIPSSMNGIKIVYFSDLEFGNNMDEKRLQKLARKITLTNADVIIFGGDVFDSSYTPSASDIELVTSFFNDMNAGLGKFAVYGDTDTKSEEMKNTVNSLLYTAGFEVLENKSLTVRNHTVDGITVVGLADNINVAADVETAYTNISADPYVITVCHTPDTADQVPADLTDYFLAGHSLGGKADFGFKALYTPVKARKYLKGKQTISASFILDITNGTGTTGTDVRFMTDPEIVCYILNSTEESEEEEPVLPEQDTSTPQPTAEPEEPAVEEVSEPSAEETTTEETPQEEVQEETPAEEENSEAQTETGDEPAQPAEEATENPEEPTEAETENTGE